LFPGKIRLNFGSNVIQSKKIAMEEIAILKGEQLLKLPPDPNHQKEKLYYRPFPELCRIK
jgi:hypothetical protein